MATSTKPSLSPARYAEAIYAGWHKEDTICYQHNGVNMACASRQTILYLPGSPSFFGSGASQERWISYGDDGADECRKVASELRSRVASAATIEEAAEIVNRHYEEA